MGVDDLQRYSHNANRALLLFSDGEDTSSTSTFDRTLADAQAAGVKIYTVGLSSSMDKGVLAQLALGTGGAYSQAVDARQLISLYGALGNYLGGYGDFYRSTWRMLRSQGNWATTNWVTHSIAVDTGNGVVYIPLYIDL